MNHFLLTLIFYDLLVNASPRLREVLFMYPQTRLAWKSSLLFYNLVMNLKKNNYSDNELSPGKYT